MNDGEWSSWESEWRGAAGPLPALHAAAGKEARLDRRAHAAFFLLVGIALATLFPIFADRSPAVHAIGWIIIAFCAAMSVAYVVTRGRDRSAHLAGPRESLAFLQRRLRLERRMAHVVRWVYAGLFVAFVVVFPRTVADHESPRLEMILSHAWMLIAFAVTFSAPWWVARRNQRRQDDVDRWRRWIDEQNL